MRTNGISRRSPEIRPNSGDHRSEPPPRRPKRRRRLRTSPGPRPGKKKTKKPGFLPPTKRFFFFKPCLEIPSGGKTRFSQAKCCKLEADRTGSSPTCWRQTRPGSGNCKQKRKIKSPWFFLKKVLYEELALDRRRRSRSLTPGAAADAWSKTSLTWAMPCRRDSVPEMPAIISSILIAWDAGFPSAKAAAVAVQYVH